MEKKLRKKVSFFIALTMFFSVASQPVFGQDLSEKKEKASVTSVKGLDKDTYNPNRIIVTFEENISQAEAEKVLDKEHMEALSFSASKGSVTPVDIGEGTTPDQALEIMANKKQVAFVQPDYLHKIDGYTNDTDISSSKYSKNHNKYHYIFHMGLAGPGRTAWNYATGQGVNVAVLDTGANINHYDLKSNVKGCYDAVNALSGKSAVYDEFGHGTATAGILAATGNNKLLSAGIAYNSNLFVIKVAQNVGGSAGIYTSDTIKGIQYAIDNKCRVISMSYGGDQFEPALNEIIDQAYKNKGVLFVAAGGNAGKEEYHYPASYSNCLSVSALNYSSGKYIISPKSTYNNHMDIAAPGQGLYTLSRTSNTAPSTAGATSAAAPYVAGVAALIFQADPSLTAAQCAQILTSTATDAGTSGYDKHYGYGIINPLKAVQRAVYKTSSLTQKINGVGTSYTKTYTAKPFTLKPSLSGSGTIRYSSSNSAVASVTSAGKVTPKKIGKTTITLSSDPSGIYKSAKKSVKVTVTPKTGVLKSLKNLKSKKLRITWSRDKKVTGYVIKAATNSKFKKAKTYYIKKNSSTSKTIAKLKKNKTYWLKIRGYKTINGTKIYGPYSKVKRVKIRR